MRISRTAGATFVGIALGLALPLTAAAAEGDGQQLFDAALRASREGQTELACELFRRSYQQSNATGTLLNVALCDEAAGRFVAAYNAFVEVHARSLRDGKAARAETARAKADELARSVGRIALENSSPLAPGETLWLDGAQTAVLAERHVASESGSHRIELRGASGAVLWKGAVEVKPGAVAVARVERAAAGVGPEATGVGRAGAPTGAAPAESAAPSPSSGPTQRTVGLVLGGVGLVGLAVGGVAGGLAFSRKGDADAANAKHDAAAFKDATTSGETLADVSTVACIAGAAALGAGVVLFVTAPRREVAIAPWLGPGQGGASVRARF